MREIETFYVVPKREWEPHPPRSVFGFARPPKQIIARWTNSEHCHDRTTCLRAMKEMQTEHIDLGLDDIGYNFVIGGDDTVYEGRGWSVIPMVTEGFEELQYTSILIGFIGVNEMIPTKIKFDIIEKLKCLGKRMGYLSEYTAFFPLFDVCLGYPMIKPNSKRVPNS